MTQPVVASIQMTSSDKVADNLLQAKKLIQQAVEQNAQLVVLPEMFAIMGLDQTDKVKYREAEGQGPIQDFLHEQALQHNIWIVGGTIPITVPDEPNKVFARCLIVSAAGKTVAHYDKIHLFDVTVPSSQESHYESRTTQAGKNVTVVDTPFGKLGIAVCYDLRFPELFRAMHEKAVEIVAVPAAFTYVTGVAHWEILLRARAVENLVYVIAAGQTGTHSNQRRTYGHSMIVNPWGEIMQCLPEKMGVVTATMDLEYLQKLRRDFPVLMHRCIRGEFK